jgi:hypothetical protein
LDKAQASRLFIEGQRFLMQEDFDRAYFYFQKARELSLTSLPSILKLQKYY